MAVAPAIADRHHVLAPDLVGFGRTPPAGRACTPEGNLGLLERFIEEVAGAPALVVGHSMGGYLAMRLAARRPDLVTGAVLVSPAAPPREDCHPMPPDEEVLVKGLLGDPVAGAQLAHAYTRSLGAETLIDRSFGYMHARPVDAELRQAHIVLEAERMANSEGTLAYLETYRAMDEGAPSLVLPYVARNAAGWSTGLQVQNLGSDATTVVVLLQDESGVLVQRALASVQPGASRTFYLPTVDGLPDGWRGSATVMSSPAQPLGAIVNETRY